jgi:hypothetical protein
MDGESSVPAPSGAAAVGGGVGLPSAETFSGNISEVAKVYVADVRAALEHETWDGAGGYEVARRFSTAVDELVRFVVDNATCASRSRRRTSDAR